MLIGLLFGWIPAIIGGIIGGFLWPLILFIIISILIYFFIQSNNSANYQSIKNPIEIQDNLKIDVGNFQNQNTCLNNAYKDFINNWNTSCIKFGYPKEPSDNPDINCRLSSEDAAALERFYGQAKKACN